MHHLTRLRQLLVLVMLAWPPLAWCAEPAAPAADGNSLAGQLLVATPSMGDERFFGTVILVIRDGKDGAFGIVLNRPVEDHAIADLLDSIGEKDEGVEGTIPIFAGGPVQPGIGFVLHSAEYHQDATLAVTSGIALTTSATVLHDIGHHRGPKKVLFAFGYAGWGPGQLEREMALQAWATTPADPALVFDEDRERLWDVAWARRSISL